MSKGKMRPGVGGFSRPGGGAPGGGGGGGGGGNMLAQLQKLQDEMAKTQEKLNDETVEVTVGGGMVKAVMNGHQKLMSLTIAKEAVDPDDVEMLQDMVVAAINEAVEKSQGLASERMGALTGGLNIPGLT
jgi:DNA-binding YbaB/EbfC family protein